MNSWQHACLVSVWTTNVRQSQTHARHVEMATIKQVRVKLPCSSGPCLSTPTQKGPTQHHNQKHKESNTHSESQSRHSTEPGGRNGAPRPEATGLEHALLSVFNEAIPEEVLHIPAPPPATSRLEYALLRVIVEALAGETIIEASPEGHEQAPRPATERRPNSLLASLTPTSDFCFPR